MSNHSTADTLFAAENTARLRQFEIGYAAALLGILARTAGEPGSNATVAQQERYWLQAGYLADQIAQHTRDLSKALDTVENVVADVRRGGC